MNRTPDRSAARNTRQVCSAFFAALILSSNALNLALAEGFRIYGLSAEAQSRGEAVVASGSDASQAWYNPAGLTRLGATDVTTNFNNMILKPKYTNGTGVESPSQKSYFFLPAIYVGSKVGTEKWAFGLAVNAPFGLSTDYDKTYSARYITTGGDVQVTNINPSVAYKVHPTLSVAAGLVYYDSMVELRQQYPWGAVAGSLGLGTAFPDGSVTVQGKGDGVGFNTGILYQPNDQHAVGLTYRSQVTVKYGLKQAEVTNIPTALQPTFGAGSGDKYATGAKSAIRFPDIVGLGYAYKPNETWTWEIGGQWTNWDDVRSLDIDLDRPTALFPNSSARLDWKNSFVIRTGVEHKCSDKLSLSGGYFYDASPVTENTYTPLVPDGDHHVLSVGAKYTMNNWVFTLPVVGILQAGTSSINSDRADVLGTQPDGKYTMYAFTVSLGITYLFK